MDRKLTRAASLVRQAGGLSKGSAQHALETNYIAGLIENLGQASKKNSLKGRISDSLYKQSDEYAKEKK